MGNGRHLWLNCRLRVKAVVWQTPYVAITTNNREVQITASTVI